LILDDLLISLDMNNRNIVLDILLHNKVFQEYQKIILTHDKAFFEIAKQKFQYIQKDKWKYFEMYLDINQDGHEVPYIKEFNSEYGNLTKAKEHFKNKDYPACANYLRKEVEKKFDDFLKIDNLDEKIKLAKLKENEHLVLDIGKDLKKLITVLKKFENCKRMPDNIQIEKCNEFSAEIIKTIEEMVNYIDNKFHFEEFEDVKLILKSILHPQSHNDITKPLYKKELEDAIELVEAFNVLLSSRYS